MTARSFRIPFNHRSARAEPMPMLAAIEAKYTHTEALMAGLLIDITACARTVFVRHGLQPLPAAVSAAVWSLIRNDSESVDDGMAGVLTSARTESMVRALAKALRASPPAARQADHLRFVALSWAMEAVCGAGDAGEPVITILLEDEVK